MTTPDGRVQVRVERRIAARPSAVYAYLTDSVKWARWQGHTAEIEAVPGGRFRMTLVNGTTAEGRFVELQPDRRVVFTWGWQGHATVPPGSSTVEIELAPDGDGTLVRLTHRGLPADEVALHNAGWSYYLPRLEMAAGGGDPGPDVPPSPPPTSPA
jgi:uncharacterized protein YndB with AHSA1/START domain